MHMQKTDIPTVTENGQAKPSAGDFMDAILAHLEVLMLGFGVGIIFTVLLCCCVKVCCRFCCCCGNHSKLSITKEACHPAGQCGTEDWNIENEHNNSHGDEYCETCNFETFKPKTGHKNRNAANSRVDKNPMLRENTDATKRQTTTFSAHQKRCPLQQSLLCHRPPLPPETRNESFRNVLSQMFGNIKERFSRQLSEHVEDTFHQGQGHNHDSVSCADGHMRTIDEINRFCQPDKSDETDGDVAYINMDEIIDFISEKKQLPAPCHGSDKRNVCNRESQNIRCSRNQHNSGEEKLQHHYVNMRFALDMEVINFLHEVHSRNIKKEPSLRDSEYVDMGSMAKTGLTVKGTRLA